MYLYNLDTDIRESANVAKDYPTIAKELDREMNRHFTAVSASLPKPNPDADPAYKPYDPDAPEAESHAKAPTEKKPSEPTAKKPNGPDAKKLERQKRREARKKANGK